MDNEIDIKLLSRERTIIKKGLNYPFHANVDGKDIALYGAA